jgi:anaerobic ribonucleoside-triphosphate reductase activating protein
MASDRLRTARVIAETEAEGPGRRFAVWLQGCPLRCPGCCNPEMLREEGGVWREVDSLARELEEADVEGLTLLGGEPFAQAPAAAALARAARRQGRSVMVFSGFTLAELRARPDAGELLEACDLLVDGPYLRARPEPAGGRRWIGSANQVMHFFGDRYAPDEPRFRAANTVEIRLTREALTVNGWPAASRILGGKR